MKKSSSLCRILLLFYGIILILFFSACRKNTEFFSITEYDKDAWRLDQSINLYNTDLNIFLTIPRGWWIHDLNTANLSPDPADTVDASTFDIIHNENSDYMFLASFANSKLQQRKKFIKYELFTALNEKNHYFDFFDYYFPENDSFRQFSLLETGSITIDEIVFQKTVAEVSNSGEKSMIAIFITKLESGHYLLIIVSYWQKNKEAANIITNFLSSALKLQH